MFDLGHIDSIKHSHKDFSDKIETQRIWENTYNKRQIRQILREEFKDLFKDDEEHLNLKLDVMGIIAEREHVYFDTIIEMLVEKGNISESKQIISEVLLELCERDYIDLEPIKGNQKIWRNYIVSGYLTIGSDSLILNNNHHLGNLSTDILDRYNQIPLTINTDIVRNIRNCWGDLFDEETNKLTEEYKTKLESFEKFERLSIKFIAMLVNQGNRFWHTHKYDKRGRIYSIGYWVNPQGNSYQKACVEFYNKELITDEINFF